jgi:hypothetical protein
MRKKFAHFCAIGLVRRANASRPSRSHRLHDGGAWSSRARATRSQDRRVDAHGHVWKIATSRANACVQESRVLLRMHARTLATFVADASHACASSERRTRGENNLRQVVDS